MKTSILDAHVSWRRPNLSQNRNKNLLDERLPKCCEIFRNVGGKIGHWGPKKLYPLFHLKRNVFMFLCLFAFFVYFPKKWVNFKWQYLENKKSYKSSAGGKTTEILVPFKKKYTKHRKNAVHCHSQLSGNNYCHEFSISTVRIVISASNVKSL